MMSTFIYFYSAAYFVFYLAFYQQQNRILYKSRFTILIFIVMLLWLFLQQILSVGSILDDLIFHSPGKPDWFAYQSQWSVTPENTALLFKREMVVFAIFLLSLSLINTRQRIRQLLLLILVIGLLHSAIGIVAKYANVFLVDKKSLDGHFDAARGLFINRNHFAAFVSLSLFGSLALCVRFVLSKHHDAQLGYQEYFLRSVVCLVLLVSICAIFFAESRAGFLAISFTLFLLFLFLFRKKQSKNGLMSLLVVVTIVVGLMLLFGQGLVARFSDDSLSIGERSLQWQITWNAIEQQLLFGYGAGSYQVVFQVFREFADLRNTVVYDQAHNDYLHLWLEQGLVGLLLWLMLVALVLIKAIRKCIELKSTLAISLLVSGCVVVSAALIQSLVDYNLQIMNIRCYFFV